MSRDNRDAQSKSTTNAFPNSAGRRGMSEEAAIFNTFMNVIKNRFTAIPESPTSDSKKKGRPRWNLEEGLPEAYDAERKLLVQINNNGMGAGLVIALGSFLFLRRGPKIIANYVSKKRAREQPMGGYQFDPPDMAVRRKPGILFRTFKFGLDLFVATSMGMYGSAIWTDKNKLMNDLANIPLVEGKSIISEELCDDFIDVYRHIPKRTWDKYNGKSEPLDAISLFVQNCLKRHAVENQILKERNSFGSFEVNSSDSEDEDVHPSIPSPGVSPDVSIDIVFSDESQELETEKENDEFSFEGDDSELFQFENESDETDSPHKRF